jgi:enoyl-CoA hydratase
MSVNSDDRWARLRLHPPPASDAPEPEQPVLVEYVSGGRVALVTLNRPHADNAISTELAASLIEILETIAARTTVRVAILAGVGDRAFSIGGDLRQRKNMTKEDWLRQRQVFDRMLYTLRQLRKPIIAAVHGMAYGGGCEIAISSDFIIASEDALFGQQEAAIGLSAGGGSPVFLPRVLPPGKAVQMLMTGEPITAQEAYRLGMVNEVHPRADLMPAVLRIAEKIAATRRPRCRPSSGPYAWATGSRSSRRWQS